MVAGALLLGRPIPGRGSLLFLEKGERELVPGRDVSIWWPPFLDHRQAMAVHLVDGREVMRWPVPAPTGTLFKRVAISTMPADGTLAPGRHEFLIDRKGSRIKLGFFKVSPFYFGC